MHHALAIADDVVVLAKGEVAYSGPVAELGDITERLLPAATDAPGTNGHSGTRRP